MSDLIKIRQGDLLPTIAITTSDNDGPPDFTTARLIQFTMTHKDGTVLGGLARGDALGGLEYAPQLGDTNKPGYYKGLFTVWNSAGKPKSFPTEGEVPVQIIAR